MRHGVENMISKNTTIDRILCRITPHPWFAWRPVKLDDGRWAWLSTVLAYYWYDPDSNWAGSDSCWRYIERGQKPVNGRFGVAV